MERTASRGSAPEAGHGARGARHDESAPAPPLPAEPLPNVPVRTLPPDRFGALLPPDRFRSFLEAAARGRDLLAGRVVWNVNSTARGGGVAEMLASLLAYARGAGIDVRWSVIEGDAAFFAVTKRIHNHLHGFAGDGGPLGAEEAAVYREATERNARRLAGSVAPGDVVILHDPQTAGLCGPMKEAGAAVIWRCHVGVDVPNGLVEGARAFLRPHVAAADASVFSRRAHVWGGLDASRIAIIPPSIDAFSPKNQQLDASQVQAILAVAGVVRDEPRGDPTFLREDGSVAAVTTAVDASHGAPAPPPDVPLVVQVSRWDRLKDPAGVVRGFVGHVAREGDAHLVVAGPSVEAVADDPEGAEVLREVSALWRSIPTAIRDRIHLLAIPMTDREENAAIVNALQCRADVVVQKSIAEGFGLTVAEAMWKARPVVASRIGGIQDQIEHGRTGLLVDDPTDLRAYGEAVAGLLAGRERAEAMGREAQRRVLNLFLGPRHLMQYLDLLSAVLGRRAPARTRAGEARPS